jgi:hypothetical protein
VDVVINRSTRARGVYTGKEAAALDEEERNRHARSTLLRYKLTNILCGVLIIIIGKSTFYF